MVLVISKIKLPTHITDTIRTLMSNVVDHDVVVNISKMRKKRSLDANAYYWVLLTKLAKINGFSNARQHNLLLRDWGQVEIVDGQLLRVAIPDTDEAEAEILEKEKYHLKLTTHVITGKDGITYRTYYVLRGSSNYDTAEMGRLIEGLIMECQQVKIPDSEIMTPDQKEELKQKWGVNIEEKNQSVAI